MTSLSMTMNSDIGSLEEIQSNGDCLSLPSDQLAFTRKDLKREIKLSARTIRRLELKGLLHPSASTRKRIYSREEIQRYLRDTTLAQRNQNNTAAQD